MGQRLRIGLLFSYYENWIGGTYYFLNLIAAFKQLPDEQQPIIYVFSKEPSEIALIKKVAYPYLIFTANNLSIYKRAVNKLLRIFKINTSFYQAIPNLDILFSSYSNQLELDIWKNVRQKLYWIPDFQESHFPEFFSLEKINRRKERHQFLIKENVTFVFSSQHAKSDFYRIYPNQFCRSYVLRFAVTHSLDSNINIEKLKGKYKIDRPYFITPNQFWKHKNHFLLLKAIKKLVAQGHQKLLIVFTGKEFDPRNPNYVEKLKNFVNINNLTPYIRFLGFIERGEQLLLIKNAIAVIQPSLFEGWSTVVEDGKALSKLVIASSIEVHKEQLMQKGHYFEPQSVEGLSSIIWTIMEKGGIEEVNYNYSKRVENFAKQFLQICHQSLQIS